MKTEGKCALVTGGASGIGKTLVNRLLHKGAKFVALIDYDEVKGKKAAGEFGEEFGADRVRFFFCDVSDDDNFAVAFEEAFSVHNRLDIVVNNAGVWLNPKILQINLGGIIRGTYLAKKYMDMNDGKPGGVVINTCSTLGVAPVLNPEYTATKFGVRGFSLAMANCDPAFTTGSNIRMVIIVPPAVNTPFIDSDPDVENIRATANFATVNEVVDAFLLGIEDDTKHACCILITPGKDIEVLPAKSVAEWEAEMNMRKT